MSELTLETRTLQGIYLGAVSKAEVVDAPDGQNPPKSVTFTLTIVEAPHKEDVGQTLSFIGFYLRKKTGEINQIGINQLGQFVCAVMGQEYVPNAKISLNTEDLLEELVTVRMENETYKDANGADKLSLRMKEYWPADKYQEIVSAHF